MTQACRYEVAANQNVRFEIRIWKLPIGCSTADRNNNSDTLETALKASLGTVELGFERI